jgi:small subunit ribosomal protein S5
MTVAEKENTVEAQNTTPQEAPAPRPEGRSEGRGQRGGGRGAGRGPRRGRPGGEGGESESGGAPGEELSEKVVSINRNAKVVKGGRRFSFSALVVVGDRKGRIGLGLGKAAEVSDAIRKGGEAAKSSMMTVAVRGTTLPHEVTSRFCGSVVLLRPASPGTGVIAGKTVRAVLEAAGVKDVLSKCLGSNNASNVAKATVSALRQLRLREEILKGRGIEIKAKEVAAAQPPITVVNA